MTKVYNIGIIDIQNASSYPSWKTWLYMLKRVTTNPTYVNVKICDEWLHFSNFNKWYNLHYRPGWDLDKDLKGHLLYSPDTCVYLPKEINQCLQRHKGIKKSNGVWIAEYSRGGQIERIGEYGSKEEAQEAYLKGKKEYLDYLVQLYRHSLDRETQQLLREYKFV